VSDFRQLSASVWASPQICEADVTEASALGFALIINNRPEGESLDQTEGAAIVAAAAAHGLAYLELPVSPGGFAKEQVTQMAAALDSAQGPVLAYCRSGTRSTLLWSLAQASKGRNPTDIAAAAAAAGYDVSPIAAALEHLAAQANG
jgi:uncharacterized protein (TIGR01244 family)